VSIGIWTVRCDESESWSASPSECAGSVETTSVLNPARAVWRATAADVEVLPTPPFPPTRTNRGLASSASRSLDSGAVVIIELLTFSTTDDDDDDGDGGGDADACRNTRRDFKERFCL